MNDGTLSFGFDPVATPQARVLILGSLPGRRSLADAEYYAQPRNAFWRIMGELVGADPHLPYAQRLRRLTSAGIALWDVLAAARRPGSLDSAIERSGIVVNDIDGFLTRHTQVRLICCNGGKAAELLQRNVLPTLTGRAAFIAWQQLPSTSPAYASMPYEDKLRCWRQAIGGPLAGDEPRRGAASEAPCQA